MKARRLNLRDRRTVLLLLFGMAAVLFVAGIGAAILSKNDTICPDGKPPIAQQPGVMIGQTEYLCHGGKVVTK